MKLEPSQKRTVFAPNLENALGIFNGGINFQAVANDAGVGHQTRKVFIVKSRNVLELEIRVSPGKTLTFFQNRFPRQPRLVDLEDQTLEQTFIR